MFAPGLWALTWVSNSRLRRLDELPASRRLAAREAVRQN